ncbi:NAD-dependent epimerase/dehydratase family protein [Halobacteria archaeon AArc-curdl1]|uniref:NAD-dependent epimerase/dehydratase family protein n=1 Tax=Natronosalvus hydrolyticus TaxID=2979988 RepID=A0AAP2ZCD9_9EURY|nr:NAD-dependent epimerase/dehydratase family protein [Halobacteria archaeon AArc-curdl1]
MTYLITGVAGFIGSNIARHLLCEDHTVYGLDNLETGLESNLEDLNEYPNSEFIDGDLRNEDDVETAVAEAKYVLHQGAVPSVPRSVENPVLSTEANCTGTANLIKAAHEADVEKIVVASSSSVYGPTEVSPKREDLPPNPVSPYALSKYYTEQLAVQASDFYDLDSVALRYFNVFGPHQNPEGDYAAVIPKFINLMLKGEQPVIYGDGTQSRDFTYIDNVIQANLNALESEATGVALNAGCGNSFTINTLVDEINDILGTEIEPIYDDPRPGDVPHSKADVSKARDLIDYDPKVNFREGLERTVEYFSEQAHRTGRT